MKITVTIKKRTLPQWLLMFLVMFPVLLPSLVMLGLPSAIHYCLDAVWMALCVCGIYRVYAKRSCRVNGVTLWVLLFFVYTFLVYLVVWQSPVYYLWGIRNNFRFYAAFLSAAAFLKEQEAEEYLSLFDSLFCLNFVFRRIIFIYFI